MFTEVLTIIVGVIFLIYTFSPGVYKYKNAVLLLFILLPILSASHSRDYFLRGSVIRVIEVLIFIKFLMSDYSVPWKSVKFSFAYMLFFITCLFASLISFNPLESVFRSVTYLEPLLIFTLAISVAYNYEDGFYELNRAMLIGIILVVGIGVMEFILQNSFLNSLGFFENPEDIEFYFDDFRTISGRVVATIGQPVYTAFFLLSGLSIILYKMLEHEQKWFYIFLLIITLFIIFITGTRAIYPTTAGLLLFFMTKYGVKNIKVAGAFVILFAFLYSFIVDEKVLYFISESSTLSSQTTANVNMLQRVDLSSRLYTLFLNNFWLGLGPGTIQKMAFGKSLTYNPQFEGLSGLENHYFTILADTGAVGSITYIAFLFMLFYSTIKLKFLPDYLIKYKTIVLACLVFFLIGSVSVNNLASVGMLYLFIMIGNFWGKSLQYKNDAEYSETAVENVYNEH